MNRQEAEILLQNTFKLPAFYDEQWQDIREAVRAKNQIGLFKERA